MMRLILLVEKRDYEQDKTRDFLNIIDKKLDCLSDSHMHQKVDQIHLSLVCLVGWLYLKPLLDGMTSLILGKESYKMEASSQHDN